MVGSAVRTIPGSKWIAVVRRADPTFSQSGDGSVAEKHFAVDMERIENARTDPIGRRSDKRPTCQVP